MKAILYAAIVLALAVLACGCASTPPAQPAANTTVPNLTGTWTGPGVGYVAGTGFTTFGGGPMTMSVAAQKDRVFEGTFTFPAQQGQAPRSVAFVGAIARDGRTMTVAQQDGGYSSGTLLGPNEIELIHLSDSGPMGVGIDTLKRG